MNNCSQVCDDRIASTINRCNEHFLNCWIGSVSIGRPIAIDPNDPAVFLDVVQKAQLKFCYDRTETLFPLLRDRKVLDAAILSRSLLEAAAKSWDIVLSDPEEMEHLKSLYSRQLSSELRRLRGVGRDVEKSFNNPLSPAEEILRLLNNPQFLGIDEISSSQQSSISGRFKFGKIIEKVEEKAAKRNFSVNFSILRYLYSVVSNLGHAGAQGLLLAESLVPNDDKMWSLEEKGNASAICASIVLCWYCNSIFRFPFSNNSNTLYNEALSLLNELGEVSEQQFSL